MGLFGGRNRPYSSCSGLLHQNEIKSSAIDMEMIFHSHANKTHFHKKGCALGLILKVRGFGTRNWPITPTFLRNLVPADRDFQQITIAVVDAESWGEYVTVVSQIANRRNVDFYTPAIATTPQDSFTFRTWQSVISKPVHFVIFGLFYFRPPQ